MHWSEFRTYVGDFTSSLVFFLSLNYLPLVEISLSDNKMAPNESVMKT